MKHGCHMHAIRPASPGRMMCPAIGSLACMLFGGLNREMSAEDRRIEMAARGAGKNGHQHMLLTAQSKLACGLLMIKCREVMVCQCFGCCMGGSVQPWDDPHRSAEPAMRDHRIGWPLTQTRAAGLLRGGDLDGNPMQRDVLGDPGGTSNLRGWLRAWAGRMVAEHVCTPPSPFQTAIPSEQFVADGSSYRCPECEQVFGGADDRKSHGN